MNDINKKYFPEFFKESIDDRELSDILIDDLNKILKRLLKQIRIILKNNE